MVMADRRRTARGCTASPSPSIPRSDAPHIGPDLSGAKRRARRPTSTGKLRQQEMTPFWRSPHLSTLAEAIEASCQLISDALTEHSREADRAVLALLDPDPHARRTADGRLAAAAAHLTRERERLTHLLQRHRAIEERQAEEQRRAEHAVRGNGRFEEAMHAVIAAMAKATEARGYGRGGRRSGSTR